MLAAPEVVDAHNKWTAQIDQQTASLKKWKEDQAKSLGRKALEQVDSYVLNACRIFIQRKLEQPLDEASLAQQEGLQGHFLSRWLKVIEESIDEPILIKLRDTAINAKDSGPGVADDLIKQQADELKGVVQVALDALRASEQPANAPALTW